MENSPSLTNIEYSTHSMNAEDYLIGKTIGFGSAGIVYSAIYIPTQKPVAIKMIDLDRFERNQIDALRKEIQVMSLCKHPNVLAVLASFLNASKLWIVTPLLSAGSCLDIMKSNYPQGFDEQVILGILWQALSGLEYLHRNNHIHRDVKSGNLLMDHDGVVKLADFGVSSSLMEDGERRGMRKTFVGTPCWMAPEVMEMTKGYDTKADIWSFGITALELCYGNAPFARFPPMKVIYLTLNNQAPTLDRHYSNRKYSKAFKDMIDLCLQKDPSKRPTAEALLKHPFFRNGKKASLLGMLSTVSSVEERSKEPLQEEYDDEDDEEHQSWVFESDGEKEINTQGNEEHKEDEDKKDRNVEHKEDKNHEHKDKDDGKDTIVECNDKIDEQKEDKNDEQNEHKDQNDDQNDSLVKQKGRFVVEEAAIQVETKKGRFSVIESPSTDEVQPQKLSRQSSDVGPKRTFQVTQVQQSNTVSGASNASTPIVTNISISTTPVINNPGSPTLTSEKTRFTINEKKRPEESRGRFKVSSSVDETRRDDSLVRQLDSHLIHQHRASEPIPGQINFDNNSYEALMRINEIQRQVLLDLLNRSNSPPSRMQGTSDISVLLLSLESAIRSLQKENEELRSLLNKNA